MPFVGFNENQSAYLEARAMGQKPMAALRFAKSNQKHLRDWRRSRHFVEEEAAIDAAIAEEMAVSRDDVIDNLRRAAQIAEVQGDVGSMVRAMEAIAKVAGLNAPTRQIIGHLEGKDAAKLANLEHLTDEQLLQVAQGQGKLLEGSFEEVTDDPASHAAPEEA